MIEFMPASLEHRERYEALLAGEPSRGCEYSFANLYLWGKQNLAFLHGCVGFFSHFYGRSVYPFPIGPGDKRAVLEAYIQDAAQRGIPCRITGISPPDRENLEQWFPEKFQFREDRDSADYVYAIDDLADLQGRKYQKKRNHVNRFFSEHPQCRCVPLTREQIPRVAQLAAHWYAQRETGIAQGAYILEKRAIRRCLKDMEGLQAEGCLLLDGEDVLAFTIATWLSDDTMDVHFEKAREDVDGAYAAINREFARYLREKYPRLRYLNREDDLGLEGLRKAKLSYLPHHLVEKSWAYLAEELYEN